MLETTFVGVSRESWDVWGTWATVAATLGLGVATLIVAVRQLGHLRTESRLAGEASRAQIEALRDQVSAAMSAVEQSRDSTEKQLVAMERARRASVAPLVVPRALVLTDFPGLYPGKLAAGLRFENLGSGVALEVKAKCAVAPFPPGIPRSDPSAIEAVSDTLAAAYKAGELLICNFASLGAQATIDQPVGEKDATHFSLLPEGEWAAAVSVEFHDQFCENPSTCLDPHRYPRPAFFAVVMDVKQSYTDL